MIEFSIEQFYLGQTGKMGQQCCTQSIPRPLLLQGWARQQALNGAYIWKNNTTGEEMEEYAFMANNNHDYDLVLDAFNLRLNHQYLVSSKNINNQPDSDLCGCGTIFHGQIFLQRIPLRLSNVNQIPFPDILHVYNQAFKGFKIIAPFVGYFIVDQEMICINSQDIVKVWVNGDLSRPYPDSMQLNTEAQMIATIINIIDRNTQQSGLPANLKNFFLQRKIQTFDQAILAVQEYARLYNAIIPLKLDCVTEIRLGKQKTVVKSHTNEVIVNQMHVPPKIPAILGSAYTARNRNPAINTVRSTECIRPVTNNVVVNRIPQIIQNSQIRNSSQIRQTPLNQSVIKKPTTGIIVNKQPKINPVSPIRKTNVSVSPVKTALKVSNIKLVPQPVAPIIEPRAISVQKPIIKPSIVPQTIIPKPVVIQSNVNQALNTDRMRKVQDGHTNQNILEMIRQSRQLVSSNVNPQSNLDYNITAKTEYNISEIQSQPKQSDMSAATKDFYFTPDRQFQKLKQLTTDHKSSETQLYQSERQERKTFQTPQKSQHIMEHTRKATQTSHGSTGTTSFQFFGIVGLGNSTIKKSRQFSQEKTNKTQSARQQVIKADEYLSSNTSYVQSRIQAPSEYVSTPIKQQVQQSTTYNTSPYKTEYYEEKQYKVHETIPIQPHYATTYQTNEYSYQPITSSPSNYNYTSNYSNIGAYNGYSSNNYMDIYNISNSYSNNYMPLNNYDLNNYGSRGYSGGHMSGSYTYNDYNNIYTTDYASKYLGNIDYSSSKYGDLNTYSNNYSNNYTSPYTNTYANTYSSSYSNLTNTDYSKYNLDTYKSDYQLDSYKNYDYGLTSNKNFDYGTLKSTNLDTYIVPTYDNFNYNIPNYEDIKATSNFTMKETQMTTNASHVVNSQENIYNYESHLKFESHNVSTAGYNIENLASIYIPIQGYKVTLDNQLIADLQKLRARGLMEEAILKERSKATF